MGYAITCFVFGMGMFVVGIVTGSENAKLYWSDKACSSYQTGAVYDMEREECVLVVKKSLAPPTVGP